MSTWFIVRSRTRFHIFLLISSQRMLGCTVLTQLSENCWISRAFWAGQCSSKRDSRESRRVFEPARPHWTHISDTTGVETSGLCYLGPTVSQWNKRHIRHDSFWDPLNTVGYCGIPAGFPPEALRRPPAPKGFGGRPSDMAPQFLDFLYQTPWMLGRTDAELLWLWRNVHVFICFYLVALPWVSAVS